MGMYGRSATNVSLRMLRHSLANDFSPDAVHAFWRRQMPTIVDWASRVEVLFSPSRRIPYLRGIISEDGCNETALSGQCLSYQEFDDGFIQSVSFTRAQIYSLICQAFLCTIPGRDRIDELPGFSPFSFLPLFSSPYEPYMSAKLKMLFVFFSELPEPELALTRSTPEPTVQFWRRIVSATPDWTNEILALPRFSVEWQEGVEDCADSVQVGMSNKYPGGAPGGVLSSGKMQEPVFFAERPELLVALLMSPVLKVNEALIVSGARQFGAGVGIGEGLRAVVGGASSSQRDRAAT